MQQGRMAGIRDQAVALLNEVKMTGETSAKADLLKTLMELVLHRDPSSLLPEFVPYLMELQTEPGSPIRKYLAECVALPSPLSIRRVCMCQNSRTAFDVSVHVLFPFSAQSFVVCFMV
jgi:hypothetical protein